MYIKNKQFNQSGFTLIELLTTIVILGSLVSVAMPKFVNLRSDSVVAATKGLAGSLLEASVNIRLKCATTPSCTPDVNGNSSVTTGGSTYALRNGWVDAGDNINDNEIDLVVLSSRFTVSLVNSSTTRWIHESASDSANCYVTYTEAANAVEGPKIVTATSSC